ncbi:MAG: AbgT family transporter, partial [Phycisphaerales bacterium]|nr:AbgT family transporter [Phycisphaerales bacterium]
SKTVAVRSLLDADGVRWILTQAIRNFLDFPPLAIVLVAMLGIGVAERTGLFPALLKLLVIVTPRALLSPAVVFIGIMSSAAADAGYVVLPPLAAGVFARVGRSPLAGIAAATFGVAGGFSANLAITSLDPLLQGLTEQAARALDPNAIVRADCNWYFMMASTFLMTGVGWFVTDRIVEPRFDRVSVERQLVQGGGVAAGDESLSPGEWRGLWAALAAFAVAGGAFAAMAIIPGGPLTGEVQRHGTTTMVPSWTEAIVPMLLVLFLLPGIAFGMVSGEIRSDRCVANRMGAAMAGMGTYVVLAFFAGQAIAWFRQSNLATVIGIEGAEVVKSLGLGAGPMLVAMVGATALLNLLVSSASAKWAFLAPVLVPMLAQAGMRPELVQAAYRVGDSCTNPIAPLNAYLVIILVAIRRWQPDAGIGTLIALLVPYCVAALVTWTAFLVAWESIGIPLGPG